MDEALKRWLLACAVILVTACLLLAVAGIGLYLYAMPSLRG